MIEVFRHPSRKLIDRAHADLKSGLIEWPKPFESGEYWAMWWGGDMESSRFCEPVILTNDGFVEAIIGFTDLRPEHKTLEVHFCASRCPANPVGLFRAASRVLDEVLSISYVNLLYGHIKDSNARGIRTAKAFGFKEIANVNGIWYSAKH